MVTVLRSRAEREEGVHHQAATCPANNMGFLSLFLGQDSLLTNTIPQSRRWECDDVDTQVDTLTRFRLKCSEFRPSA